jgi:site-specific DNA-methyltransferase (adenine-specific)
MHPEYGLPSYPDNYFDLAIVDPPYGIGEDGSKNHTRGKLAIARDYKAFAGNDKMPPSAGYFRELVRVSRNQIVWGANHFIDRMPYGSPCWIVWDKDNGGSDFADCELAWTSFRSAVRKAKFKWAGMLQEDMKNKEHRIHPTQKPVSLYRWLLENYAQPGQLILDTHVGSASSLIACESMGFNYVGFEIDPDYYAAAKNRMSKGIQLVIPQ